MARRQVDRAEELRREALEAVADDVADVAERLTGQAVAPVLSPIREDYDPASGYTALLFARPGGRESGHRALVRVTHGELGGEPQLDAVWVDAEEAAMLGSVLAAWGAARGVVAWAAEQVNRVLGVDGRPVRARIDAEPIDVEVVQPFRGFPPGFDPNLRGRKP